MAPFASDSRSITVTTPLGPDVFMVGGVSGSEGISRLFEYSIGLTALSTTTVEFDKLLGQNIAIAMEMADGEMRYLSGMIVSLVQGGTNPGPDGLMVTSYQAELVPKFWLLSQQKRSRIFQQKNVPDILAEVLTGFDIKVKLNGTYEPRYCTQ
jgi:type VI secretion system secreted protein VgrG